MIVILFYSSYDDLIGGSKEGVHDHESPLTSALWCL